MSGKPNFAALCDTHQIEDGEIFSPRFGESGVLPVVTTDARSGEVLMLAYMNELALALTIETGEAHYWSRSREKIWRKGETSGNTQKVVEIRTDCDQDAIWLKVEVSGHGASCHVGFKSCFYRSVPLGEKPSPELRLEFTKKGKSFDPKKVYGEKS